MHKMKHSWIQTNYSERYIWFINLRFGLYNAGDGIGGADGGLSPPIVIDSIVISPSIWMNRAEFSGNRWLNSQKCLPLMATLKQLLWAKINTSTNWPRAIGLKPSRSSAPQQPFFRWLRTRRCWSRRMLKCKSTSSRGCSAGPVWTLISMNLDTTCAMWPRMRIMAPCARPPGILHKCGNDWGRWKKNWFYFITCRHVSIRSVCPWYDLLTGLYTGNVLIVRMEWKPTEIQNKMKNRTADHKAAWKILNLFRLIELMECLDLKRKIVINIFVKFQVMSLLSGYS